MTSAREPQRLEGNLANIRVPVRVLIGGAPHQGGIAPEEVARLAASLPDFAADTIAGAGHYIQEERPDRVVAAVRRLDAERPVHVGAPRH